MQENDVTQSNIMEMKFNIIKENQKDVTLSMCSDLLQNNSLQFSIACIDTLC